MMVPSRATRPLSDFCTDITVGFVGTMSHEFVGAGVPLLRGQNVRPYKIDLTSDVKFISPEFHAKLKKSQLRAGDVVAVRVGYPGVAAVVPPAMGDLNCASLVVMRPDPERLDSRFLAYWLNSPTGRSAVGARLVGSAQQVFNTTAAAALPMPVTPIDAQRRIADVLSAYDDLIENNTRRIKILEEMARALYREWFVEMRAPGCQPARGKRLPAGWTHRNLFDLADVTYGFPFKSRLFTSGTEGVPVVRIRDLPGGSSATRTDEPFEPKYAVADGDFLIGMDGNFHLCKWSGGSAALNQRVVMLRPRDVSRYFLVLSLEKPIRDLENSIVGTTVAHLGDAHLRRIDLVVPDPATQARFDDVADGLYAQELSLKKRNENLRATRDLLLPRLLSGEIELRP